MTIRVEDPQRFLLEWLGEIEAAAVDMCGSYGDECDEKRREYRAIALSLRFLIGKADLADKEQAVLMVALEKLKRSV